MNKPGTDDAACWARFYFERGFCPLPSRTDRKGPWVPTWREHISGEPIPTSWLDRWWSPNIQLCLGVPWKLLVVDCDGWRAITQWYDYACRGRSWPRTWEAASGSGRGRHFYYRIPPSASSCPSRTIWQDVSGRARIEVLGDGKLVIAPPSIHVETGLCYFWHEGRSPLEMDLPSLAPAWLWTVRSYVRPGQGRRRRRNGRRTSANGALARTAGVGPWQSVHDIPPLVKKRLVQDWGLRLLERKIDPDGWLSCRAYDREDVHPSARFNLESGVYFDFSGSVSLSMAALSVRMGAYGCEKDFYRGLGIGRGQDAGRPPLQPDRPHRGQGQARA